MIYKDGQWVELQKRSPEDITVKLSSVSNGSGGYRIQWLRYADSTWYNYERDDILYVSDPDPDTWSAEKLEEVFTVMFNIFVNRDWFALPTADNFTEYLAVGDRIHLQWEEPYSHASRSAQWMGSVDKWKPYAALIHGNLIVTETIYTNKIQLNAISNEVNIVFERGDDTGYWAISGTKHYHCLAAIENIDITDRKLMFFFNAHTFLNFWNGDVYNNRTYIGVQIAEDTNMGGNDIDCNTEEDWGTHIQEIVSFQDLAVAKQIEETYGGGDEAAEVLRYGSQIVVNDGVGLNYNHVKVRIVLVTEAANANTGEIRVHYAHLSFMEMLR